MPLQSLACLNHRKCLRRIDAQRLQHFGGKDFAHRAFQRQPAICRARIGRGPRPLGTKIQNAAILITHLRKQESASIADFRIIDAKLMPVIAQRQRLFEIFRQRLKLAKMTDPRGIIQPVQAN